VIGKLVFGQFCINSPRHPGDPARFLLGVQTKGLREQVFLGLEVVGRCGERDTSFFCD